MLLKNGQVVGMQHGGVQVFKSVILGALIASSSLAQAATFNPNNNILTVHVVKVQGKPILADVKLHFNEDGMFSVMDYAIYNPVLHYTPPRVIYVYPENVRESQD